MLEVTSAQTLTRIVDSLTPSYLPRFLRVVPSYLTRPYQTLRHALSSNGGDAHRLATGEHSEPETQLAQVEVQSRLWQPPNYQKPESTRRAYLEVNNVLRMANKVTGYDACILCNRINKRTERGSQEVGLFDPNTGMISTTDESFFSAIVRAIELLNNMELDYRMIGVELVLSNFKNRKL
ncbi:hypothetical protein HYY71_03105 [Candidatus Woesearchaeota archaeon]|nr:hypothetical protein [Candidatus Woesearchaeota archaeon]